MFRVFIKDVLSMKESYEMFNFLRKKRNSLVYYGDMIEIVGYCFNRSM